MGGGLLKFDLNKNSLTLLRRVNTLEFWKFFGITPNYFFKNFKSFFLKQSLKLVYFYNE